MGAGPARIRRRALRPGWPPSFGGQVTAGAAASLLLLVLAVVFSRGSARAETRGGPPWPAPGAAQVATGVRAAGLPMLAIPGQVVRFAVHLDVLVDGRYVTVPAGIGIDGPGRRVAPLYTDDSSGVIHVASDSDQEVFTLGQFFDEWQVPLAAGHLGGLRISRSQLLVTYVDGSKVAGNPDGVLLTPHLEIVVTYRPGKLRIPDSYAFPAGT
jgi:hypothetical protein